VTPPRDFISTTFHARDIFAPAACHLARGGSINELGPELNESEIIRTDIPSPVVESGRIKGRVIAKDNFGNLITTIKDFLFDDFEEDWSDYTVQIGKTRIKGISKAYIEAEATTPVALFGSSGRLEIAIYRGSASEFLGADKGVEVTITW
jgi:hypothetical protein